MEKCQTGSLGGAVGFFSASMHVVHNFSHSSFVYLLLSRSLGLFLAWLGSLMRVQSSCVSLVTSDTKTAVHHNKYADSAHQCPVHFPSL